MVDNKEQFGFFGLDVKGITIHNTGNRESARENYDLLCASLGNKSTHFFVDESEVIQFMPLDYCVYHTGMGIDWACKHSISIEICRSMNDLEIYQKAETRAVNLIKELMETYNLTTKNIYFHQDFKPTYYCPHRILDTYGNKQEFIRRNF